MPPWYRVAPIDFGRRKLAKTELTPHPKRKLVTFALHQHFVFTVDKIAALLKTRPSAFGMSDPIWGPLIHIFVDEKKN